MTNTTLSSAFNSTLNGTDPTDLQFLGPIFQISIDEWVSPMTSLMWIVFVSFIASFLPALFKSHHRIKEKSFTPLIKVFMIGVLACIVIHQYIPIMMEEIPHVTLLKEKPQNFSWTNHEDVKNHLNDSFTNTSRFKENYKNFIENERSSTSFVSATTTFLILWIYDQFSEILPSDLVPRKNMLSVDGPSNGRKDPSTGRKRMDAFIEPFRSKIIPKSDRSRYKNGPTATTSAYDYEAYVEQHPMKPRKMDLFYPTYFGGSKYFIYIQLLWSSLWRSVLDGINLSLQRPPRQLYNLLVPLTLYTILNSFIGVGMTVAMNVVNEEDQLNAIILSSLLYPVGYILGGWIKDTFFEESKKYLFEYITTGVVIGSMIYSILMELIPEILSSKDFRYFCLIVSVVGYLFTWELIVLTSYELKNE